MAEDKPFFSIFHTQADRHLALKTTVKCDVNPYHQPWEYLRAAISSCLENYWIEVGQNNSQKTQCGGEAPLSQQLHFYCQWWILLHCKPSILTRISRSLE